MPGSLNCLSVRMGNSQPLAGNEAHNHENDNHATEHTTSPDSSFSLYALYWRGNGRVPRASDWPHAYIEFSSLMLYSTFHRLSGWGLWA